MEAKSKQTEKLSDRLRSCTLTHAHPRSPTLTHAHPSPLNKPSMDLGGESREIDEHRIDNALRPHGREFGLLFGGQACRDLFLLRADALDELV